MELSLGTERFGLQEGLGLPRCPKEPKVLGGMAQAASRRGPLPISFQFLLDIDFSKWNFFSFSLSLLN